MKDAYTWEVKTYEEYMGEIYGPNWHRIASDPTGPLWNLNARDEKGNFLLPPTVFSEVRLLNLLNTLREWSDSTQLANADRPETWSEGAETYHFSLLGRPYTQILAEVMSITPLNPTVSALDIKFAHDTATLRVVIDAGTTTIRVLSSTPYIDGSPAESFGV